LKCYEQWWITFYNRKSELFIHFFIVDNLFLTLHNFSSKNDKQIWNSLKIIQIEKIIEIIKKSLSESITSYSQKLLKAMILKMKLLNILINKPNYLGSQGFILPLPYNSNSTKTSTHENSHR